MKKEQITQEQYNKILDCFIESLMKHGFKATTMDSIASSLQMSKRTLYEIFDNKEKIFQEAIIYFHKKVSEELTHIFLSSSNVMEGIINCFKYNRDLMSNLSADSLRDLQEYSKMKSHSDSKTKLHDNQYLVDVLQKGVEEGFFRDDINFTVHCKMLLLQMEALKRTEELFPEDISLLEVYDNIIIGFLRGISSSKGLTELDKFLPSLIK